MIGKTIKELQVGDFAEFAKTVSESDVYQFAGVTGDQNPAHINEAYAQKTIFETRIAHGLLSAGYISAVLGMKLPGPGTIYMKQDLKFLAPARIGDTLTAKAEIIEILADKNRVVLHTTCTNQEGKLILDGKATVSPPKA